MARKRAESLAGRALAYDLVGVTCPASVSWDPKATGYRIFEATQKIGDAADWPAMAEAVMTWQLKTRSGFSVDPPVRARVGVDYWLRAHIGPFAILEPVRVVAEVNEPARCGYAYGTLAGHPVSGEEAFIVHHRDDGVYLTLRSVTRAGAGVWRIAFPAVLVAQLVYRRRYLRALQV